MTDARFPERWLLDRRLDRLDDRDFRSFTYALMWAVVNMTDGVIEPADLKLIPHFAEKSIPALLQSGLWEVSDDSRWQINDFKSTQMSGAEHDVLDRNRKRERDKKVLFRDPELRGSIRARDQDMCRYCGLDVDWHDRRSDAGGTYDHVIPGAGSTYDNLVVACRGCNCRKGRRVPEQAGMQLLPPGSKPGWWP